MFYPDFETVKALSGDYNVIPVTMDFSADMDTPISIFKKLETDKNCFLLESVEGSEDMTRYSFIGRNPFLLFESTGNVITVTDNTGKHVYEGDPMAELQRLSEKYHSPIIEGIPQFSSGAVGHFSYDVVRLTENLPNVPTNDLNQPDMHFMFTDELVAFDHKRQRLIIIVNMHTDGDLSAQYERSTSRIAEIEREIEDKIIRKASQPRENRRSKTPVSNMTKEDFCNMVTAAKEYIKDGDIFQVVLSQRFSVETDVDPFNAYRAIRLINPSPYMYYLKFDDYQITGASPEMLVRCENGIVQTSPIAGTRPRGKTPEEDERLEQELIADPKENAEHVMLVDLGRNDIGKLSEFGTVHVSRFKYIQRFSHVMHMTSDVRGKMRSDVSVFDSLRSVLPAGTLSGAPKVRAMEIIDSLENVKRGTYGGAIGYISFNGNLDSCITIRTALFKDGRAYVQSGGGIVYDSIPENEYNESVNKAASMIKAIESAEDLA